MAPMPPAPRAPAISGGADPSTSRLLIPALEGAPARGEAFVASSSTGRAAKSSTSISTIGSVGHGNISNRATTGMVQGSMPSSRRGDVMNGASNMALNRQQLTNDLPQNQNAITNGLQGNYGGYRGSYGGAYGGNMGMGSLGMSSMSSLGMLSMMGMGMGSLGAQSGPLSWIYSLNYFITSIGHMATVLGMNSHALLAAYQSAYAGLHSIITRIRTSEMRRVIQRKCKRSSLFRFLFIAACSTLGGAALKIIHTYWGYFSNARLGYAGSGYSGSSYGNPYGGGAYSSQHAAHQYAHQRALTNAPMNAAAVALIPDSSN